MRSSYICKLEPADRRARLPQALRGHRSAAGRVLARMEQTGIRVDPAQLGVAVGADGYRDAAPGRADPTDRRQRRSTSIRRSNWRKVLFEDLKLPAPVKYGKGKTISTAADILEELAVEHEIARKVLEYRQLAKLKGTYVDALPALIRPRHRPPAHHLQPGGRGDGPALLLESEPAEHPDPHRARPRDPRGVRSAQGWKLVVADYSQIELRLLAHMSKDPVLVGAFRNGEDIHTRTAAEVFGRAAADGDPEMRRNAKAVNFGIVYGQTPFGLAQRSSASSARKPRSISATTSSATPASGSSSTRRSRRCGGRASPRRCSDGSGRFPT